ncbi:MAG: hypothetical protein ACYSTS_00560 [Planctomycetota bacterium]
MQEQKQDDLTKLVIDKFDYQGEDEVISWDEIRKTVKEKGDSRKLYSNIPTLDKVLEGFEPGELI